MQLEPVENRAEQGLEVGECLHAVAAHQRIVEVLVQHAVGKEIDERVGFGVDVVLVEQHFGKVEDFAEAPDQRLDVTHQVGMRAQRIEIHAVGLERRVVAHFLERPRGDPEARVAAAVFVVE